MRGIWRIPLMPSIPLSIGVPEDFCPLNEGDRLKTMAKKIAAGHTLEQHKQRTPAITVKYFLYGLKISNRYLWAIFLCNPLIMRLLTKVRFEGRESTFRSLRKYVLKAAKVRFV
jgi:hypothetical protein